MEPLVIVAAAIVAYCCWLALVDELRDWGLLRRRERAADPKPSAVRAVPPVASRAACPGDGGGVRWPVPAKGSA